MDTTLRDGEQTSGVSFAAHEKLSIAQMLLSDLGVNRVEVASARVSDGEFEAVKRVAAWAERTGNLHKLEVLGFVDGDASLNWIESAGCRVVNLLCKGSYKHVTEQLRKLPEQHIADIRSVVSLATEKGIDVNIYLEDWSNGIKNSPDYVFLLVDALKDLPIRRFMLPDTLVILTCILISMPITITTWLWLMSTRLCGLEYTVYIPLSTAWGNGQETHRSAV